MTLLANIDTNEVITFDMNSPYAHLRGTRWRVGRKTQCTNAGRFIVCQCIEDGGRENVIAGETRYLFEETEVSLG